VAILNQNVWVGNRRARLSGIFFLDPASGSQRATFHVGACFTFDFRVFFSRAEQGEAEIGLCGRSGEEEYNRVFGKKWRQSLL
jgi:hypothetical protein